MKTLYLLRHAKSSWKDRGLDDLDRPLNKRGRETAKTMAAYLRRAKITPDLVLCSTAVRAKQTLEPIAKAIKLPRVAFESRIYGVAQPELLKYLRGLPETVESALMIGHNPGLHDLALALADTKSRKRLPPAEGKFPTGAVAAFRFDGMALVVDASILVAWAFDEVHAVASEARERMHREAAAAPALWWFEVLDALIQGERRRRFTELGTARFLRDISRLVINVDRMPGEHAVLTLARRHRLTVYDAAYLELACGRPCHSQRWMKRSWQPRRSAVGRPSYPIAPAAGARRAFNASGSASAASR